MSAWHSRISSIPGYRLGLFAPEQTNDATIARWAQALADQDLELFAASVEDEMSKTVQAWQCPFEDGHPQCRCDQAVEQMNTLSEKKKAVEHEIYVRHGMSAHKKLARIAAARATP
jgi:hypothetical protein